MKKTIRILLIDDNPRDIRLIQEFLKETNSFKFQLEKVNGLTAAKSFLSNNGIDVILLDLDLSDSHGIEVFKGIKGQLTEIPTIVLSRVYDGALAVAMVREGVQDYLVKGAFDGESLRHAISFALERKYYIKSVQSELTQTSIGFIKLDKQSNIVSWNKAAENIYGYSEEDIIGKNFSMLFTLNEQNDALDFFNVRKTGNNQYETTQIRKDGTAIQVLSSVTPIKNESKEVTGYAIICQDVSFRKSIAQRLYIQYQTAQALSESPNLTNAGITILQICCEVLQWQAGEIWVWDTTKNVLKLTASWQTNLIDADKTRPKVLNEISKTKKVYSTVDIYGYPIIFHEELLGIIVFWGSQKELPKEHLHELFNAVTNQIGISIIHKRLENDLLYFSQHDPLTNTLTRTVFEVRLRQAITNAESHHYIIAVLYLDLDNFKQVNDAFGHDIGDLVLKEVAVRLTNSVRKTDTVARMGGDEFTVFLLETSRQEAALAANKILLAIAAPMIIDGNNCYVTASIGISLFPQDSQNVKTLIINADEAMYQAKQNGKNQICFSQYVAETSRHNYEIENAISRALEKNEFILYYQPIVSIKNNRITSYEALLRWRKSDEKIILPQEFIRIAEKGRLIFPLGKWIIKTVCLTIKKYPEVFQCPVAINISARQFSGNLLDDISQILTETKVNPENIILEITESALIHKTKNVLYTLNGLKNLGIAVSLDDFGTGYASLTYLLNYAVSRIKIDQSFIADLPDNERSKAIVDAIIAMGHALNITVIAEGVETPEQLAYLAEKKCDRYQGFYFCKPLSEENLVKFVKAQRP